MSNENQEVYQEEQENAISTVAEFLVVLEATEDTTLDKAYVIETLKAIATSRGTSGKRRGQLAGLNLAEMSDEQLKREAINAKSVHYKAVQRGASAERIAENQARVDAVVAEITSRKPVVEATPAEPTVEVETNDAVAAEL